MGNFLCGFLITGTGLGGMRQRDLIQWYVNQQNEKNNYSSMEEAAAEISKIKAIIEVHIILHPSMDIVILSCAGGYDMSTILNI